MLVYKSLCLENFHQYERDILASEEVFPPEIRETAETYRAALAQKEVQAYLAFLSGRYAGNVIGFSPCPVQQQELRLHEVQTCPEGLIYLFNIVALPEMQGCGLGQKMLAHFLEASRAAGFQRVGGHFRDNRSLKNFLRIGADVLHWFDDWFGTGEAYAYCELYLDERTVSA